MTFGSNRWAIREIAVRAALAVLAAGFVVGGIFALQVGRMQQRARASGCPDTIHFSPRSGLTDSQSLGIWVGAIHGYSGPSSSHVTLGMGIVAIEAATDGCWR